MTDFLAKKGKDGSFAFFDPLEETEEPIATLPNPPGDAQWVVDWLQQLGFDISVE